MSGENDTDESSDGISLDELPTEDPLKAEEEAGLRRINAFKDKKKFEQLQAQDVRALQLAGLPPELKLRQMSKVFEFDKREPRYELLALYLLPLIIKYASLYDELMKYMLRQRSEVNFLLDMLVSVLGHAAPILHYAELLVVFLFFVKPPLRSTPLRFIINFEGIDLPQRLRIKSTDLHQRRRIKWSQIHSVQLNTDYLDALELFDLKGDSLGMLRWDLWKKDKVAFEKITSQYIGEKHPLRKFLLENG